MKLRVKGPHPHPSKGAPKGRRGRGRGGKQAKEPKGKEMFPDFNKQFPKDPLGSSFGRGSKSQKS